MDATGNNRVIANMLAKQNYVIHYSSDNLPQPPHQYNAILHFKAKTIDFASASAFSTQPIPVQPLIEKGWNYIVPPAYYMVASQQKEEIYILCEIPTALMGKKPQDILDFVQPIIKMEYQRALALRQSEDTTVSANPSEPIVTLTDDAVLLFSTFSIKHEIAEQPFVKLGNKGCAIVVGDARCPANFHFGHGIEKALADGENLGHAFARNRQQCDYETLIERGRTIQSEIRSLSTKYLDEHTRKIGKAIAAVLFSAEGQAHRKPTPKQIHVNKMQACFADIQKLAEREEPEESNGMPNKKRQKMNTNK